MVSAGDQASSLPVWGLLLPFHQRYLFRISRLCFGSSDLHLLSLLIDDSISCCDFSVARGAWGVARERSFLDLHSTRKLEADRLARRLWGVYHVLVDFGRNDLRMEAIEESECADRKWRTKEDE